RVELALVADRADKRAFGAARNMHAEPMRADLGLDRFDLGRSCLGLHHDNHDVISCKGAFIRHSQPDLPHRGERIKAGRFLSPPSQPSPIEGEGVSKRSGGPWAARSLVNSRWNLSVSAALGFHPDVKAVRIHRIAIIDGS